MWIDGLTSYYIEGDHIWSSWVRGICLPCVILRREGRHDHIWISIFLWRQFRDVGLCPIMAYGRGLPIYGSLHPSTGCWVPKMCLTLLLIWLYENKDIQIEFCIVREVISKSNLIFQFVQWNITKGLITEVNKMVNMYFQFTSY